jgi:two-component sensor histidine kinase
LADIAASTLAPYRVEKQTGVSIHGPDVSGSREAGTTLALCLHELATNAIKYGALSRPEGQVRLRWGISPPPDPLFTLQWEESGGPPAVEPSRVGYGTRFMRSALSGLFGERPDLIFAAEGLRCTVRGPLSRISPNNTDQPTS